MKESTRAFLLELADLLEKHGAEIEAHMDFVPYEGERPGVEFSCAGGEYVYMHTAYVSHLDIREKIDQ